MEDYEIVEAVNKLWTENLLNSFIDPGFHAFIPTVVLGLLKTKGRFILDCLGSCIGCHDENCISEVNVPPKRVCESTFFHHLKKHVENVWMSFFNLIKENNRIWTATNFFSELASFFESNVSGRGTNETTDIVLFHVFTHIN